MATVTLTRGQIYGFAKTVVDTANSFDELLGQIHKEVTDLRTVEDTTWDKLLSTITECVGKILTVFVSAFVTAYVGLAQGTVTFGALVYADWMKSIKNSQIELGSLRQRVNDLKNGCIPAHRKNRMLTDINQSRNDLAVKIREWTIIKNNHYDPCSIL